MCEKLAKVAFELFAKSGFRNVNLDQISAKAGVTKGSLYWHYKSKKEVILAACDLYYRNWHFQISEVVAKSANSAAALHGAISFSVESCLMDRRNRVFTTEILALALQDKDVCASWAGFYNSIQSTFVELVENANAEGLMDVDNPTKTVDLMLSTVEGIKLQAVFKPEIFREKSKLETYVNSLLKIISSS